MVRYFLTGLAVVLVLVIGLIAYGAYLNYRGENQITEMLAEQVVPLSGEAARVREIKPRFKFNAVKLDSDKMADAVALVSGRITDVTVSKNDRVSAGQVIFVLDAPELATKLKQADSNILKAETELTRARNTYHRYERLRAREATSAEKYEEAESAFRSAEAGLEAAIAQKDELLVQVGEQRVTAPIDGEVLIIYRPQGAYVSSGTSVALIGNFRTLRFSAPIDGPMAAHLAIGQEATVTFGHENFDKVYGTEYGTDNLGRQQGITARLVDMAPDISESAVMRRVLWEVDNSAGLLEPQTYSDVRLVSQSGYSCLTVPLSSMIASANEEVFVFKDDGTLERRRVETGLNDGKYIEILAGLKAGEIVVTSDPKGLADGMRVALIPTADAPGQHTDAPPDGASAPALEGGEK